MPTTAWLEVRLAMIGALRLARGDRGGLSCFDRSLDGFWRSFRAAVIGYPLYLVLLSMRVTVGEWERSGALLIITVETIAYVIAWTAFPLMMLIVTQRIARRPTRPGDRGRRCRRRSRLRVVHRPGRARHDRLGRGVRRRRRPSSGG